MSQVVTQEQADILNEDGFYGPYLAANGHLMCAPLIFPKNDDLLEPGVRSYRIGDEIRYTQYNAYCAEGCPACAGYEPLPDW